MGSSKSSGSNGSNGSNGSSNEGTGPATKVDLWQDELRDIGTDAEAWQRIGNNLGVAHGDINDPAEMGRLYAVALTTLPAVEIRSRKGTRMSLPTDRAGSHGRFIVDEEETVRHFAYYPAEGHHIDSVTPEFDSLGALCVMLVVVAGHIATLGTRADLLARRDLLDAQNGLRDERAAAALPKRRNRRRSDRLPEAL
jgi:hypothetical protein